MRKMRFYRIIASFFNLLTDIAYNVVENKNFQFKRWHYAFAPIQENSQELRSICEDINRDFHDELNKLSRISYNDANYVVSLDEKLKKAHYDSLINFFSSPQIVKKASDYLGFTAQIKKCMIYANLPGVGGSDHVGSKAFHRDSNCHRLYEIFFTVSEVTDQNGPFYFIKNISHQNRAEVLITNKMLKNDWATSGRVSENELTSCVDEPLQIGELSGPAGSMVSLNTGITYHRGGHVLSGYRIVGRIIFGGEEYLQTKKLNIFQTTAVKIIKRFEYSLGRYFIDVSNNNS
jgi:hypothetical protein